MTGFSAPAFLVGTVAHNMLYALGTVITEIPVLPFVVSVFEVTFFFLAVIGSPIGFIVGIIASIVYIIKNWYNCNIDSIFDLKGKGGEEVFGWLYWIVVWIVALTGCGIGLGLIFHQGRMELGSIVFWVSAIVIPGAADGFNFRMEDRKHHRKL